MVVRAMAVDTPRSGHQCLLLTSCQDLVVDEVKLSPADDVVSVSRDGVVEP